MIAGKTGTAAGRRRSCVSTRTRTATRLLRRATGRARCAHSTRRSARPRTRTRVALVPRLRQRRQSAEPRLVHRLRPGRQPEDRVRRHARVRRQRRARDAAPITQGRCSSALEEHAVHPAWERAEQLKWPATVAMNKLWQQLAIATNWPVLVAVVVLTCAGADQHLGRQADARRAEQEAVRLPLRRRSG